MGILKFVAEQKLYLKLDTQKNFNIVANTFLSLLIMSEMYNGTSTIIIQKEHN